ncbi:helix-turn-helix domain-containing protein [Bradyrhizobium sp. AS23.2]|uniref:IclR family transcriptional regulator n=1 Tax=Bradyrhizobium sp. AS23.2 TaxID=1680155 RepID=UPI00093B18DF|nr:helix-turn-helix domain-containing protein [Bradyrhizobium sp. AS23.2]
MHIVESVRSAVAILRFLASQPKSYGVNAIARELGISPSTCFNIVKTLALEGLLEFDERDKSYSPGPALATLSPKTTNDEKLFRLVEPVLSSIAMRFSCTATLWRVTQDRLILIDSVQGAAMLNVQMRAGLRLPALIGAMGRCVAGDSNLPRREIESAFRKINWQNPPPFRAFLRDAEAAKENGWAIDIDNYMRGLTTVAAPIRDMSGRIQFFIANIVLSGARNIEDLDKLCSSTAAASITCSKRLYSL